MCDEMRLLLAFVYLYVLFVLPELRALLKFARLFHRSHRQRLIKQARILFYGTDSDRQWPCRGQPNNNTLLQGVWNA